jgi:hypothetical protein
MRGAAGRPPAYGGLAAGATMFDKERHADFTAHSQHQLP